MKQRIFSLLSIILTSCVFSANAADFAGSYMTLGAGPRGAGLGMAQVAVADDSYATFWNPAGLVAIKTMDFNASYSSYFGLVNQKVINFAHAYDKGVLAFNYISNWVDGIQNTTYTDSRPLVSGRDFGYNSAALIISKAHYWGSDKKTSWGVSLKLMGEGFSERPGASGVGVDFGVQHRASDTLRWGYTLQNIIKTPYEWNTPSRTVEALPFIFKVGMASVLSPQLEGILDLEFQTHQKPQYHAGLEYTAYNHGDKYNSLVLRSGLDNGSATLGMSLHYKGFKLDYAYRIASVEYLEPTHLVSVGFSK